MSPVIAVVDDDAGMRELLSLVLGKADHVVRSYATPGRFFDDILKHKPDICVVDVQLPGMDGRDIVRVLRADPVMKDIPVILMSAVARSSADAVQGFGQGADEYLPKPLDLDLLLARVTNLLSRSGRLSGAAEPETIRWGAVAVVLQEHRVTLADKDVALTNLEFKLLLSFLRQPDRVLARSWLLETVWDSSPGVATRTVDKHVESLRRELPPLRPEDRDRGRRRLPVPALMSERNREIMSISRSSLSLAIP